MRGVYWQTWSSKWTSAAANLDLVTALDPNCDLVYLAFANPSTTYKQGSLSFGGTGLDFSMDFSVVRDAIKILKTRGVNTLLSVGGATYQFNVNVSAQPVIDLARDLGVDGIDLDWEPTNGAQQDDEFPTLIKNYRAALWPGAKLSAAVFSTGAYGKNGDTYQGMNIKGLVTQGSSLDWINLMAYDAGPPPPQGTFDPLGAFTAYRMYYPGPIVFGFEPGPQSWGGHVIQLDEVKKNVAYVLNENPNNGIFVWSAQKDTNGSVSVSQILKIALSSSSNPNNNTPVSGGPTSSVPTGKTGPGNMYSGNSWTTVCANCGATGKIVLQ